MSNTFRRKNAYDKRYYVSDWFSVYEHETDPRDIVNLRSKRKRLLEDINKMSNYYHSDNYKPYSSKKMDVYKSLSKRFLRNRTKQNIHKVKKSLNYEDVDFNCDFNTTHIWNTYLD